MSKFSIILGVALVSLVTAGLAVASVVALVAQVVS